jgi:hypothetical protein
LLNGHERRAAVDVAVAVAVAVAVLVEPLTTQRRAAGRLNLFPELNF